MNLKKLMGNNITENERVEDGGGWGAILKPALKAIVKKTSKGLAKNAAKTTAKSTAKTAAKGAARSAGKAAAKETAGVASEGVLSKYFSKLAELLDNVDPEDFVKAEKMVGNIKKIIKVLSKDEVDDKDIDDIADMMIETEDASEEVMSKEDSNLFKKILNKIVS